MHHAHVHREKIEKSNLKLIQQVNKKICVLIVAVSLSYDSADGERLLPCLGERWLILLCWRPPATEAKTPSWLLFLNIFDTCRALRILRNFA
jgi:hypothetical protein